MRFFIELSYNGAAYHGWQLQPGVDTVQELISTGLRYKMGFQGNVTGCGRTDAGVHACQFFAHFDHPGRFNQSELDSIAFSLDSFLPADIAVSRIFRVKDDAHARFDAISRTYKYYINQKKNPFNFNLTWRHPFAYDLRKMNLAADTLLSFTDFTSFAKLHSDVKTNNCKIIEARWEQRGGQLIFIITADRFLRNMVRAIVGTLVEVGSGKISLDGFRQIIEMKDRSRAGMSVPAQGLFLDKVDYEWSRLLIEE
jgi:tRNA pseudouridine38-40 synthase